MQWLAQAVFASSAASLSDAPPEGPPEIAFVGRSNVGKSSIINALANRRRLAFTSRTPGRTQTINFYDLGEQARFVDLPGYGYARTPLALRDSWGALVGDYLQLRTTLAGIMLVMDARRPFAAQDRNLIAWLAPLARTRRWHIALLLSKADKLLRREHAPTLAAATRELAGARLDGKAMLFSAHSRLGVAEASDLVQSWLSAAPEPAADKKTPGKGD